jgi:signal peptidase I
MIPTLLVGDFILVNKFTYGIRLPVLNTKVVPLGAPERGDVVVFRNPENPSIPFIKRVIGVAGDVVEYRDKTVYVNGERFEQELVGGYVGTGRSTAHSTAVIYEETIDEGRVHDILIRPVRPGGEGRVAVPEDSYFVLGDNRDNSRDSRFWGFVPDANLVGRAFVIWFNWDRGPKLSRIGTGID